MADNRFRGMTEGTFLHKGDKEILSIDKAIAEPTLVELPPDPDDGCLRYRTETTGFHLVCVPSLFFRDQLQKWLANGKGKQPTSRNEGSIWLSVFEEQCGSSMHVEYRLFRNNITRYCGQIREGLNAIQPPPYARS